MTKELDETLRRMEENLKELMDKFMTVMMGTLFGLITLWTMLSPRQRPMPVQAPLFQVTIGQNSARASRNQRLTGPLDLGFKGTVHYSKEIGVNEARNVPYENPK